MSPADREELEFTRLVYEPYGQCNALSRFSPGDRDIDFPGLVESPFKLRIWHGVSSSADD